MNRYLLLFVLFYLSACLKENKDKKKICVDNDICYSTEHLKKCNYDSIRSIFYQNVVVGKEKFIDGAVEQIEILDTLNLTQYYTEYRNFKYVGNNLFSNKCYGCHNFYPDIVRDLKLGEGYSKNDLKKTLESSHKKVALNSIELDAIYEYIKPKKNEIVP